MAYQILLVDDHKIFRDGIKSILERRDEFKVIGEAENGAEAGQCRKCIWWARADSSSLVLRPRRDSRPRLSG